MEVMGLEAEVGLDQQFSSKLVDRLSVTERRDLDASS